MIFRNFSRKGKVEAAIVRLYDDVGRRAARAKERAAFSLPRPQASLGEGDANHHPCKQPPEEA